MKIAIIGAGGAIAGQVISCLLGYKNIEFTLVYNDVKSYLKAKNNGYKVIFPKQNRTVFISTNYSYIKLLKSIDDILDNSQDIIISVIPINRITENYASNLRKKLNLTNKGKILLMHNGFPCWLTLDNAGNHYTYPSAKAIIEAFGREHVIGSTLNLAAEIINNNVDNQPITIEIHREIEQGMHITIGPVTNEGAEIDLNIHFIKDMFENSDIRIPSTIVKKQELVLETLKKIQVNIAVNALSALTNKTVTELINHEFYRYIIFNLAKETCKVFKFLGYQLFTFNELEARLRKSTNHITSMATHMRIGKPLEHAYLLLPILFIAKNHISHKQTNSFFGKKLNLPFTQIMYNILENFNKFDLDKRHELLKKITIFSGEFLGSTFLINSVDYKQGINKASLITARL